MKNSIYIIILIQQNCVPSSHMKYNSPVKKRSQNMINYLRHANGQAIPLLAVHGQ